MKILNLLLILSSFIALASAGLFGAGNEIYHFIIIIKFILSYDVKLLYWYKNNIGIEVYNLQTQIEKHH